MSERKLLATCYSQVPTTAGGKPGQSQEPALSPGPRVCVSGNLKSGLELGLRPRRHSGVRPQPPDQCPHSQAKRLPYKWDF